MVNKEINLNIGEIKDRLKNDDENFKFLIKDFKGIVKALKLSLLARENFIKMIDTKIT